MMGVSGMAWLRARLFGILNPLSISPHKNAQPCQITAGYYKLPARKVGRETR